MKHFYMVLMLLAFSVSHGQFKKNAPWYNSEAQRKGTKPTLKEVAQYAENYFNTIDRNKKGSGLKPFKRWEYNWSFYLNPDGTFASKEKLWDAWRQKNQLHEASAKRNASDWKSLGPYTNISFDAPPKKIGQGRVNAVAVDPNNSNTYYAGTPAGGIWKSTDAGANWTPLTDYLPQIGVSGIAINPNDSNVIYIATGDDDADDSSAVGVWKSTDGGTTWNNTDAIPGNPNEMGEIYINPNSVNTVLVATSTGVQKTINGGRSWTTTLAGEIIDLKMKPGDSNVWYAVSEDTFYKSTDGGDNFSSISLPGLADSGRLTMDVTIANPEYVYIVSSKIRNLNYEFNGIYKSTDSGSTFTKTAETNDIFGSNQAWFDLALTVSDKNADIVYVGVLDIWKSTDGADTFNRINDWRIIDSPRYTHADIHFLRFIDGKFFAGTDGGIYISTDEASSFTDLNDNLAIGQFYRISVSQTDLDVIAGGLQDNGGFGFDGTTWRHYHFGDGMEGVVDPLNSNTFYGFSQYGGRLNITNDRGITRASFLGAPAAETGTNDSGGEWITPLTINKEGELYAGYSQVYKLDSNVWTKISDHNFQGDIDRLVINSENSDIMYVAQGNSLFRSTDRAQNFTKINFSEGQIRGIVTDPSDAEAVWVVTQTKVVRVTNISASFPTKTTIGTNTPSEDLTALVLHKGSTKNSLYLGTTLGVYFINDDLTEWQAFDTNLPNTQVRDLEINETESRLYAATFGRGVYYSAITPSGVLSTDDQVFLDGISIYPNPSQSIFKVNRTNTDEITVKVFDITGKQVFFKKNITEANFEVDMSSHSKGIYIMNMVSNGKTATRKIILQ
ncbi:T9SS type A sorting domain-containing protein [Tenacibaculum sp. 190524A05c]|uniref:T9SS type A sorting domain-containing protein n=1 Tax=Tenacibaculum platacis TaxID=3137852 RepID=UPI0031FA7929